MKKFISIICISIMLLNLISINVFADTFTIDSNHNSDIEEQICCDFEFPSVYLTYDNNRYQIEEAISVRLIIEDFSKCENISYDSIGLDILSTISTDAGVDIQLKYIGTGESATFDVSLIYETRNITLSLYAIYTDRGVFISLNSSDGAWDSYYYSGVEEGLYDSEEYNRLINAYYNSIDNGVSCETIVSGNSNSRAAAEYTVRGTLTWKDDSNVSHPLQYNKVEVYTSLGLTETLYTNASGFYSVTLPWFSSETAYIKVYPGNANSIVTTANGGSYAYPSTVTTNISKNQTVTISLSFAMSTTMGQAFQISQAVNVATEYVKAMRGSYISAVSIQYPHQITDHLEDCFYRNSSRTIYMSNTNNITGPITPYASWDVIMHEYGHHVQHYFNIIQSVNAGPHNYKYDLMDLYGKENGIKLAWAESYPSIFATMAQNYYSSTLSNISTVGDVSYDAYNFSTGHSIEAMTKDLGEGCTGSIMGLLWDMFDTATESHDTMSMSHSAYWNMITNSGAKTMSEFAAYLNNTYPQYNDKFGALLSYYKMAAYSIAYNSAENKVFWNVGGAPSLPNDDFFVYVYDTSGNQLLAKAVSTTPSSTTASASYSFSTNDLAILNNYSTVKIVIVAIQSSNPLTGGYRSAAITVNL